MGPDRFCSFNQSDPCYAAVGDKLNLLMVRDARDQELHLYKELMDSRELEVFRIMNKKKKKHESIRNRSEFIFDNGTLIINRVIRADSGTYILELYDSDGSRTFKKHLPVNIEAPIGSVEVSISCFSNQRSVSCSSDGDQIIYNWTLNGEMLEQGSMDGNTTIQLNEGTDGNISCSVKNHVSHAQKTIRVKPCPVSVVFVLVWCFQLMVLLGLLGGFHIYMRHTSGKKQEDQKVRMRRFREGPEHTAEDS
ncbi:carcinoembryonic antigen-related cell adhesion molecule 2-like [Sinocyclocheilus anshuiensis]|uniref:carcinoembryonic antigen-related cell adhesion molecule 2-like n=1 Tax=Sinocyclocheilus anshuiensis TaxID=1608454 RepID=UPI0007B94A2A|nr:PREDICTED: carcinoembryonic antigen-related cell adhesion molecule 2-like [Sinocyclocheilus anshuiensis]